MAASVLNEILGEFGIDTFLVNVPIFDPLKTPKTKGWYIVLSKVF